MDILTTVQKLQEAEIERVSQPKSLFEKRCTRFQEEVETEKYVLKTYEIISEEDAEVGEAGERGYVDESGNHFEQYPNDEVGDDPPRITFEIDEYDIEDGITIADKVGKFLEREGVTESSSSPWSPGSWFSTEGEIEDYRTGDRTIYSYHLYGFTPEEEEQIARIALGRWFR